MEEGSKVEHQVSPRVNRNIRFKRRYTKDQKMILFLVVVDNIVIGNKMTFGYEI